MVLFKITLVLAASAAAAPNRMTQVYKGDDNFLFDPPVNPFTFDNSTWKPGSFKVKDDLILEDTWGFAGSKNYLPLNHHGYEEVLELCGDQWGIEKGMPLHKYSKMGTLNWYETTEDFSNWKGHDLVPENSENYVRGAKYLELDTKLKEKLLPHRDVMFWRCEGPRKDLEEGADGGWVVERVGPMISTGGYDWWQFGWPNAGNFREKLKKHPEGIDVDIRAMQPVTADGRRIGHPPLHIHHVHVIPGPGVRPRNKIQALCRTKTGKEVKNCYNSSLHFEQHGDYQCRHEDDGIECLTTSDMRRIDHEIDIEGELNDVRPFGSEPITWYYQLAYRWRPRQAEAKPVSQMTIMAPGKFTYSDQLHRYVTFDTPTHAEHMIWYTAKMWADGNMVRNKLHAHNMVFESSQFFLATPKDLGLDNPRFWPTRAWMPLGTADLGFSSNTHFIEFLFDNLLEAQRKYDQYCIQNEDLTNEQCYRPRPRLVCAAKYDAERYSFDGAEYNFDRRPPTSCTPWKFKKGDPFTVTGFSRHLKEPTAPHKPGYIPAFIPGHVVWHFWYEHEGYDRSYFNRIICNQKGVFYDAHGAFALHEMVAFSAALQIETGIPRTHNWFYAISYLLLSCGMLFFASTGMFIRKKIKNQ